MKTKEIPSESVRKQKKDYILQADGERFLPWMDDLIINYEHLHHGCETFLTGDRGGVIICPLQMVRMLRTFLINVGLL